MDAIAEAAGLTKRTPYYHLDSKDALQGQRQRIGEWDAGFREAKGQESSVSPGSRGLSDVGAGGPDLGLFFR